MRANIMLPRYSIAYHSTADKNLNEIKYYYDKVLEDPFLGAKTIFMIDRYIKRMKIFPERGDIVGKFDGEIVHRAHWKQFNIYFWVDAKHCVVHIIHVIDAHRKYRPVFDKM